MGGRGVYRRLLQGAWQQRMCFQPPPQPGRAPQHPPAANRQQQRLPLQMVLGLPSTQCYMTAAGFSVQCVGPAIPAVGVVLSWLAQRRSPFHPECFVEFRMPCSSSGGGMVGVAMAVAAVEVPGWVPVGDDFDAPGVVSPLLQVLCVPCLKDCVPSAPGVVSPLLRELCPCCSRSCVPLAPGLRCASARCECMLLAAVLRCVDLQRTGTCADTQLQ